MTADVDDLVQVYATAGITEAYLAKGRLEAEGIPVLVKGEGEGPYRMGPAYLWVPASLEVNARMILDALDEGRVAGALEDEVPDGSDDALG